MVLKRVVDLIGSAVGLTLLSPLLLVLAVAILVETGRPVLFRQARLGRELGEFRMLKFRTMAVGASPEAHQAYIEKLATDQPPDDDLKKLTPDPRVTRVGSFLRRTSLDELPQLANVLLGSMSLVGPRPALEYELQYYRPEHFERFSVKPGITGLWQVSGRNELGFVEMLDLDADYARSAGLMTDAKILVKTPIAAVSKAA